MPDGLVLRDLTVHLRGRVVVRMDRRVAPGEVLTVMGPSGIGKSTLLAAITGTLAPGFAASGRIVLNDRDVTALPAHLRRIGILFQDDLLFPHLDVAGNLGFGLAPGGTRKDRRRQIDAALAEVGLTGFGGRDPATLSGGQRARVALMRTLLSQPEALLLDEAFSRLDAARRDRTRRMVFDTARLRGLPVLMVTHDPDDAAAAGGAVATLGNPAD
ncbi:ABC transporter, ATPase subunit [Oceaniovalibus guishaninsula JLT2003]|uniref:ABC transporter, ATPase subunit n=1 Tax=Oceaniovalibus guishaninsula JLT2003 TaxID=1231392 RepID=K2GM29_9RHOB|nr:ATP-binding cassette domain-containing protein [Oceaniovalibus guishaninsula]EKE43786.1 ABC transporter, ATPase subunit [Oceaniovalibus guishaninsula JLT2003]